MNAYDPVFFFFTFVYLDMRDPVILLITAVNSERYLLGMVILSDDRDQSLPGY
jgi:hypothetical protein